MHFIKKDRPEEGTKAKLQIEGRAPTAIAVGAVFSTAFELKGAYIPVFFMRGENKFVEKVWENLLG
jgi:hypothetical protein